VAFTFANAIEYLDRAKRRGLAIDPIASRVSFFFASHNDLFEEAAKFRAARRLWATIVRERWGGTEKSGRLRFHTQTGGSTLTAQQPLNNVVRVTVQALAAVLGGTQSLHTNGYDEALALPTEESARLALRTQQILAFESGATQTVDPLGGSYYVEHLTDTIEREARSLIERIDADGGAGVAIERGVFQDAIARAAYEQQRALEGGTAVVVGVNRFASEEPPKAFPAPDYGALAARQVETVRDARNRRDEGRHREALQALEDAAREDRPMMHTIIEAVRARATVGEVCDALRAVWGTHRPRA
jgi:methylmalonyl-CoA mutase N-terminal domain/subunit